MERRIIFSSSLVFLILCLLLLLPGISTAGTTEIEVRTEGFGVINKDTGEQNPHGAMVWNGSEWVVNGTWAHMFFVNVQTGQRLKSYAAETVNGISPTGNILTYAPYEVTRNIYTYSKPAADGSGTYTYEAVEYVTSNTLSNLDIILRSRGTGNGTASPYFDIYIQDDYSVAQTTALRGDPVWYTYPMVPAEAVNQTDATAYRTGDFPSVNAGMSTEFYSNGYYLDIGGGADLGPAGIGKSFEFITDALSNRTTYLTGAYPVQFMLKWMDLSGNLQMISYFPSIVSESFQGQYTLTVTKAGTGTGTVNATGCTLSWGGAGNNTGTCTVNDGTSITLSGSANAGSIFTGWSEGTGSASSCTGTGDCLFNITADSGVTATFTPNQYTITTSANPAGGGSVSCTPNPINHGSTSTCTVTTNTGYTLQRVGGTCGGNLAGNTYTTNPITANCTVAATFTKPDDPPPPPPPSEINYYYNDPAIQYTGGWMVTTPQPCGYQVMAGHNIGGTNASMSLNFTGTSIRWHTITSPQGGWARVYIDGQFAGRVSLYSSTTQCDVEVFRYNLSSGNHTIRIVPEPSLPGIMINIYRFIVGLL